MVIRHEADNFEDFLKLIEELEKMKSNIFVLFSGSKDAEGISWCPDCVKAYPIIEECLKAVDDTSDFVLVEIEQTLWKDPNNKFRKDSKLRLTCVPTLMHWGSEARLDEEDCCKAPLVELLFEDS